MKDINKKEMLAGLFLSKFNTDGLARLGYRTYAEAFRRLAGIIGGKATSIKNYRDEFDPEFPQGGRQGWHKRAMHPTRKAMLDEIGGLGLEDMALLVEEQFAGSETYIDGLNAALAKGGTGIDISKMANKVPLINSGDFLPDGMDVQSREGRERLAKAKQRIGQSTFRKWILGIYGGKCCVTGLDVMDVLRASHIVAWSEDKDNRMNPSNGLCLSATYDAAFDKHLISFDEKYRMVLSKRLHDHVTSKVFKECFLDFEGKSIAMPSRFFPDKDLLEKHRERLAV